MTLSSRHRIRNSSPGGLRPSTLPLGHERSPQYWLSHVDGEETFFVFFKPPRPGTEPRTLAWKAAVLTTTLGPPSSQEYITCGLNISCGKIYTDGESENDVNPSQQTRGIYSMLFQCWSSVEDGGPTLKQHWVNAPCLLGYSAGIDFKRQNLTSTDVRFWRLKSTPCIERIKIFLMTVAPKT